MEKNRYKVKLNSLDKVEELLQETYDLACKQLTEIQNEMNKLSNSCNLADTTIDEKSKYAKAMHDYLGDKSRAVAQKFEIVKFMGEVLKHDGDVNKTLGDPTVVKSTKLNLGALRKEMKSISSESGPVTYKLKGE